MLLFLPGSPGRCFRIARAGRGRKGDFPYTQSDTLDGCGSGIYNARELARFQGGRLPGRERSECMEWLAAVLEGPDIDFGTAFARLVASLLACGLVGLEREMRRQTAGWRTHIIIGLGATLLMILSIWLPQTISGGEGDPGRIAAQVVSGIGFLGAGAFIKVGNNMKGLTTAATIWFVAGLGLAIGAGMWIPAGAALIIGLLVLILLDPVEKRWFPSERLKLLQIWYEGGSLDRQAVHAVLGGFGIKIQTMDASLSVRKKETRLSALVKVPVAIDLDGLFGALQKTGKVAKVRLHENY